MNLANDPDAPQRQDADVGDVTASTDADGVPVPNAGAAIPVPPPRPDEGTEARVTAAAATENPVTVNPVPGALVPAAGPRSAPVGEARGEAAEKARLDAVRRYDVLDTPPDGAFDRIAAMAARWFDTPLATVSIVDADR